MDLQTLKTISGLSCVFCFGLKLIVHGFLDFRKNPNNGVFFNLLFFGRFFKSYPLDETDEFPVGRKFCNALLNLSILFFMMNLIVGFSLLIH